MKRSIDDLFPRPWLRAEDLKAAADVVVANWAEVEVWNPRAKAKEMKAAVAFSHDGRQLSKRLILGVTQAEAFAQVCGSRFLDDWKGQMVRLSVGVAKNGKATIVVSNPAAPIAAAPAPVEAEDAGRDDAGFEASKADDPLADIAAGKEARDAAEDALANLEAGDDEA